MTDEHAAILAAAADQLDARADELVVALVELYKEELPGYRDVAEWTIVENTRALIDVAIRQLRRGAELDDITTEEVRALTRRWVEMDLPADAISRSFQIGAYALLLRMRELGAAGAIPGDLADLAQDLAWKWTMLGSSLLSEAARDRAVAEARRDATRLVDFLTSVAEGDITLARLSEDAQAFGLDLHHPYYAVVARPTDRTRLDELERALRESGATETHRAVQAGHDGGVIAVLPQRPRAVDGVTIAVGPAVLLAEAASSFREAHQVLSTAEAFGIDGVVDLPALGPLTLVAVSADAARQLEAHHFRDLPDSFAEVEETVLAFLDRDQSVEAVAGDLHLHRNSVRYRLTRFRELTGLDLRTSQDLVTTWWLLKSRQARRRGPAA